jgi:hypothetical protein
LEAVNGLKQAHPYCCADQITPRQLLISMLDREKASPLSMFRYNDFGYE